MPDAFFDYELPRELIAQHPPLHRDQSRLLCLNRKDASISHHRFDELPVLLRPGDLLVLNDTRVLPARLLGRRARTGGKWEGLFLREQPDGSWEMICQAGGRVETGEIIEIEPGPLQLQLLEKTPQGRWLVRPDPMADASDLLSRHGRVPLPPYIRKGREDAEDRQRYQTVYASKAGAVAAPTAGLHFTTQLLDRLRAARINTTTVTLHVGLGTFRPIETHDFRDHLMHHEWGEVADFAARAILSCRERGDRIVAVGTTCARLLETVAATGPIRPWVGETDLYIYPPYRFQAVDALITNFHLPRSTLLLLVSAFAGVELTRQAYRTAIEHAYRFFSYGDAMLIT